MLGIQPLGYGNIKDGDTTKLTTTAGTPTGESLESNALYRIVTTAAAYVATLTGTDPTGFTTTATYLPGDNIEYIKTSAGNKYLAYEPLSGSGDFYITKLSR